MPDQDAAARYRANLQGEVDGAALYRALADAEADPRLKEVYGRLAAVEEGHAEFWRKQLDRIGARAGRLGLGWRTRALAWLARRFGPQFVLPTVNTLEQRDSGQYDAQAEAVAGGLPAAERSHARVVQAIESSTPGGLQGSALARLEGRHRAMGGNALRAAVLGANDGLVSNLSLVMGIAGAAASVSTPTSSAARPGPRRPPRFCCFPWAPCFQSRRSCFSAVVRRSSRVSSRAVLPWRRSAPAPRCLPAGASPSRRSASW